MSFNALLTIEDKTFRVISCNYSAVRDYDRFGRPTSIMYGAKLELEIEHTPDCPMLHLWAYNNHDVKTGKVTFLRRDSEQKQTELRFREAYITKIATKFDNRGEMPMTEKLEIMAFEFEYESQGKLAVYQGDWPDMDQ